MSDLRPPRQQPLQSEWAKFIAGFGYAFRGLWYVLRTQRNARIHVSIAILAILLGIVLHISAVEFAMVFVAITGVFIAEMFNTVFGCGSRRSFVECNALCCYRLLCVWTTLVGFTSPVKNTD